MKEAKDCFKKFIVSTSIMQEKILEVLRRNGPLKTGEISIEVGKKRAKEVQSALNKLVKRNEVTKSKVGTTLFWNVVDNDNDNITVQTQNDIADINVECEEIEKKREGEKETNNINMTNVNNESFYAENDLVEIYKDEVAFLLKEMENKNDLINSLQKIINMLFTTTTTKRM